MIRQLCEQHLPIMIIKNIKKKGNNEKMIGQSMRSMAVMCV